jgi:hypothetical protein
MSVIELAKRYQKENRVDVVWVQVGYFMEAYSEAALRLSKEYGLRIWYRDGEPTVGVPKSHIDKWFEKTLALGLSAGIAFQADGVYRFSRSLSNKNERRYVGGNAFSETGNPIDLGLPAKAGHGLRPNEVFESEIPGTFTPTKVFRRVCDTSSTCDHTSNIVKCIEKDSSLANELLGQVVGRQVKEIYPDAW